MSVTTPLELQDKLRQVIQKQMLVTGQKKTQAIEAIRQPLSVRSRQIYKWLRKENFPHNADNIIVILNDMIQNLDNQLQQAKANAPTDSTPPAIINNGATLPFFLTIPKESIKLSLDANGNIRINGLLKVKLNNKEEKN